MAVVCGKGESGVAARVIVFVRFRRQLVVFLFLVEGAVDVVILMVVHDVRLEWDIQLVEDGVSEFMFVLGQPRFEGAVQSMINPVAIR